MSAFESGKLAPWEVQVVEKLIQAAAYMDAAFWQQVDPDGQVLLAGLTGSDPASQAARLMVDANYGRWDRFDNFIPFAGNLPRPAGGYVYPPDLSKAELDAYLAAHPDEKDALLSPFTVVRRDGERLVATPYHVVYAAYVEPAAALLEEAAALSQNESLATYLRLEAQALRTDDYFDANMAWLDVDANLDVSIGPHETYDDQLTGQKTFYKANVLVVDRAAGAQLDKFKAAVPELQANLPVPPEFRPDQAGTLTPIELANDVRRSGQARSVMEGVAFSLPNDPLVWEAKGAKKVIMSNFVETRRRIVLGPLLAAIMDDEVNGWSSADGYFNWLLMHEVTHSLGPRTVVKDGEEITIRQALGEFYLPIEEGKADIAGLNNVVYLREHGIIDTPLEAHYAGYLSEALRSARFGPASAYGVIRSAAWNYFVEQGALSLDPTSGKFRVDMARMPQAVKDLAIKLLTIEGEGDAAAAKAFIDQYSYVGLDLQQLLDVANATVPIEFVPIYDPAATVVTPSATPTSGVTGRVPLVDARTAMQPPSVWQNFYDLTQVPRPSHHEEQATAFMADFGRKLGLETVVEDAGNVIIHKPATKGMESRPGVVLQAHMDMVPQKTAASTHNFLTDPIHAYVEDGWVHADGTTLGADDGIGVAIIMALLQADDVAHGPLEALFTVNEEDGFTGINALAPDALHGKFFINVDNEVEGQFLISSAGAVYEEVQATYDQEATPAGMSGLQITVDGLRGGHSGVDIDKGRGSAHQLMARLLWNAPAEFDLRLASLVGGNQRNAIPRTTIAIVALPANQADAFGKYVDDFGATVAHELAATEPKLVVTATPTGLPSKVMAAVAQRALIGAVYAAPQGVFRMSDAVPGLVETSGNIGILTIGDGQFAASVYVRSALDSARDDEAQRFVSVFELAGATVTLGGAYSSWPPNPDSALLALMQQAYTELFGVAPAVVAIHAGLETSVAGVKYPGLDMISIGPTILDVHSPDERLEVAGVPKVYDLLVAVLRQIK
ncbi:MAG: beta-Ala-His dipeptidase [bacterium]